MADGAPRTVAPATEIDRGHCRPAGRRLFDWWFVDGCAGADQLDSATDHERTARHHDGRTDNDDRTVDEFLGVGRGRSGRCRR